MCCLLMLRQSGSDCRLRLSVCFPDLLLSSAERAWISTSWQWNRHRVSNRLSPFFASSLPP